MQYGHISDLEEVQSRLLPCQITWNFINSFEWFLLFFDWRLPVKVNQKSGNISQIFSIIVSVISQTMFNVFKKIPDLLRPQAFNSWECGCTDGAFERVLSRMQKHMTGHVMGTSELLATDVAWIFVLFCQRPAILFSILKLNENIMQLSKAKDKKLIQLKKS